MSIDIVWVDLANPVHASAVVSLLDAYARDPMGGGEGLQQQVKARLVTALAQRADYIGLLAYQNRKPVGLLNAFEGFSTFAAQPLLNIHDVYVDPNIRGSGAGQALLAAIELIARTRGCCKLTLEVLTGNVIAQRVYQAQGFRAYSLDEHTGQALFWQKALA
jgi:GNAT superfamily N-acetyltransferase